MLIYIDNTIGEYLQQGNLNEKQQLFFSSLALSYHQGKCILFGQIGSIKALIKQFGKPINGIFQTILSKYSEIGSLATWIEYVYVITYDDEKGKHSALPSVIKEKSRVLTVNAAAQIDWNNGSCFVGENVSDCLFYELIGKHYSRNHKIRNVSLFFHKENGGGGDTSAVLKKCVKLDSFPTLCITDGDMKFGPTKEFGEPPKGSTFIACNKVKKRLIKEGFESRFCYLHISAHEAENLVPISLLKVLNCSKEGIDILDELVKIDDGKPLLFYDFKSGESLNLNTPHGKYWDSVFRQTNMHNDDNCYCKVVGEHFLEGVIEHIKQNGLVCVSLDSYLVDVWDRLGMIIFSWGCASFPSSV